MRFIGACTARPYFLWQVEGYVRSFLWSGIQPEQIDVLVGYHDRIPLEWVALKKSLPGVRFCFYQDAPGRGYANSQQLFLLAKHYAAYPELSGEAVFIHDPDIMIAGEIDWAALEKGPEWYGSDTQSYVGAAYLKSKGRGTFEEMCEIVGVDPAIPVANQRNTIGAQYVVKGVDAAFWRRVESDAISLHNYFVENADKHAVPPEGWPEGKKFNPVQRTALMWALLWNAWKDGHTTIATPALAFTWATTHIREWDKRPIHHNAGAVSDIDKDGEVLFRKTAWQSHLPYYGENIYSPDRCGYRYFEHLKRVGAISPFREPTALEKFKSMTAALAKTLERVAAGGSAVVNENVAVARWAVCQECPSLVGKKCQLCGCGNMEEKVKYAEKVCPLDKWEAA